MQNRTKFGPDKLHDIETKCFDQKIQMSWISKKSTYVYIGRTHLMLIIEDKFLFVLLVTMPLIIDIHVYFLLRNEYSKKENQDTLW